VLNVLGHDLEVADVSVRTSLENIIELASALLREVECVDFEVNEDARSQIVGIIQECIVLFGLGAGL